MAFTVLPNQQQFLVVRHAGTPVHPDTRDTAQHLGPFYFLELYDIIDAPGQTVTLSAASRSAVHDADGNYWEKVWISDHGLGPSLASDPSIRSYMHSRHSHDPDSRRAVYPKPIVLFVKPALSYGVYYEPIVPVAVSHQPDEAVNYLYTLTDDESFMDTDPLPAHYQSLKDIYEHRVLPGSTRPIICSIPRRTVRSNKFEIRILGGIWDEQLLAAQGAMDAEVAEHAGPQESGADSDSDSEPAARVARRFALEPDDLSDVSSIAWDETIGRLCVGYAGETRIAVFDFAGAPVPGAAAV